MCSLVLNADDKARVSKGGLFDQSHVPWMKGRIICLSAFTGWGYQKVSVLGRWHMKRVLFLLGRTVGMSNWDYNIVNFNHAWSYTIFKGDLLKFVMMNKNK